jgi:hypothetical protein
MANISDLKLAYQLFMKARTRTGESIGDRAPL